jgi:hypothetical protein
VLFSSVRTQSKSGHEDAAERMKHGLSFGEKRNTN